jgi:L-rhamnose mutarotase
MMKVSMKRYAKVIQVKPEKLAEYEQLHANCWEGVCKKIAECNITNFSIHYGGGYLFSYYEYVGTDYEADMLKMAQDETTQKWWEFTDSCQDPVSWAKDGEWWSDLREVFYTA